MVRLIDSQDQGELAFIKSLLDANGIVYFVQNEHFGSLYPGLASVASTVMVHEADFDRAAILIEELLRARRTDRFGQMRLVP